MQPIQLPERSIGPGHPCFVAAEVGINHNGDLQLAKDAIDAAAEAGADGVKFQNYRTEDFISDRSLTYEYVSQGRTVVQSQYEMFKRCELPAQWLSPLREHCDRRGVIFFSTPTSREGIDELVGIGAPLLKNGSDFLGHLPLVRSMAESGLPTVLSTGMATLADIDEAVRAFRDAGGRELILLHCTSSYPTPPGDVHLKKIPALVAAFGCPAGFSDHTEGIVAAVGAVVLGACFIEKHFTLDRNLPGPDHRFSSDPDELRELVQAVRTIEQNLGQSAIRPVASETAGRCDYRLSCVAADELPEGSRITATNIAFRRPGHGLAPAAADWIVGRRLGRPLSKGEVFQPHDFA